MTVRRPLSAALALLLTAAAAFAQEMPNAATAPLDTRIPLNPAVTAGTLPNGVRYFIRETRRPEKRAELRLVVDVGSIVGDDTQRGLAHFVEHMAFNGTTHCPKREAAAFLESRGRRCGRSLNAQTDVDNTTYMLEGPTDKPDVLERAFLSLEDWAHGIAFEPEEIDKERGVVIEEWRGRRGAGARMQDVQLPIMLKDSRYADRLPIGTVENLQSFPHDELIRFYREWYRPELMTVVAAGDFTADDIEALIRTHFSRIAPSESPRPRIEYPVPDHPGTLYAIATDAEAPMTVVSIMTKRDPVATDTIGAYRAAIVEQLFASLLNIRFSELAQEPGTPFVNAGASSGELVRTKEVTSLGALVKGDAIAESLAAVLTEARRVEQFGFTESELARAKQNITAAMQRAVNEKDNITASAAAGELVQHASTGEPAPGIEYEAALFARFLPTITVDEINAHAAKWVADGNRVVTVSAPARDDVAVPDEEALAAAIASVESVELTAYVDETEGSTLMPELPEPGAIVAEKTIDSFGVIEWKLSNGATVVLKPTTFKEDQVVFRASSSGGLSLASDDDYISAATAVQVVSVGGLGTFSAVDLPKVLAGTQASAGVSITPYDEGLSGGSSKKDLETLFQIIHMRFTAPRPDPEAFAVFAGRIKAVLANQAASPGYAFSVAVQSALRQDHPRTGPLTAEDVDRIDFEKAVAFYRDRFADAGDFTFVFAGALDVETVRPLVERYLASLPSTGRSETWRDVNVRYPTGVVERRVEKGLEPQSRAALIFTGPFSFDQADRVAVRALGDVLETRLRETLREELGGTYGVGVSVDYAEVPVGEYVIGLSFTTDPERLDELLTAAKAEIETLRSEGPSSTATADVKAKLLRDYETNMQENSFLAGQLLGKYRRGEDIADLFHLDSYYEALTPEVLHAAAKQYLNFDNVVQVVLVPEAK